MRCSVGDISFFFSFFFYSTKYSRPISVGRDFIFHGTQRIHSVPSRTYLLTLILSKIYSFLNYIYKYNAKSAQWPSDLGKLQHCYDESIHITNLWSHSRYPRTYLPYHNEKRYCRPRFKHFLLYQPVSFKMISSEYDIRLYTEDVRLNETG